MNSSRKPAPHPISTIDLGASLSTTSLNHFMEAFTRGQSWENSRAACLRVFGSSYMSRRLRDEPKSIDFRKSTGRSSSCADAIADFFFSGFLERCHGSLPEIKERQTFTSGELRRPQIATRRIAICDVQARAR